MVTLPARLEALTRAFSLHSVTELNEKSYQNLEIVDSVLMVLSEPRF